MPQINDDTAYPVTSTFPAGSTVIGDNGSGATVQFDADALADAAGGTYPLIQTFRASGNIALTTTANTWTDTDPGGTADARPLDLVVPDVSAGDWVTLTPSYYSPSAATNAQQDFATIVNGAVVNTLGGQFLGGAGGITAWFLTTGVLGTGGPPMSYQVQAGDIEDGAVRFRHRHQNLSTTARSIFAAGANRFILEARRLPFA